MATSKLLFPLPIAFFLGTFLSIVAVCFQNVTLAAGSYAQLFIIAFGITSTAGAFFLYVFKHGGIIARTFGVMGMLFVLVNALNLVWAVAGEYGLHAA